jgi:hypothetical protein
MPTAETADENELETTQEKPDRVFGSNGKALIVVFGTARK